MYEELKNIVERAWEQREMLSDEPVREAIRACLLYTSPSPRDA